MTTRKYVKELMEMLRVQALLEQRVKAPSFSTALGVNYAQLNEKQFVVPTKKDNGHSLSFEYTVPSHLKLPYVNFKTKSLDPPDCSRNDAVSLTTCLAILDEVTSWSGLLGDLNRRRFGVSLNLRAEWAKPVEGSPEGLIRPGQMIQINTTNSKIGKTIGFTHADICDPTSGEVIAFGSQAKFLDMGLLNFALSKYGWPLTKGILTTMIPYDSEMKQHNHDEYQLPQLFQSLDLQNSNRPTFTPDKIHASLGGPLHGGCAAVLHELVGSYKAKEHLDTPHVVLKSIQVDYLSTPAANTHVEFDVQALSPLNQTNSHQQQSVCIRSSIVSRGKISSQANLTFAAVP